MRLILKSSIDNFLRYGNPDQHFLGTLIWKSEFYAYSAAFMLSLIISNVSVSLFEVNMTFLP